ncbi:MAG: type II secretion system protein GspL [Gammaproteobacteria bacterium]|nr:type II secretion system protein GspL [Gammaproteobacteria bacterium]
MRSQFIVQLLGPDQPVRWIRLGDKVQPLLQSGSMEEAVRQSLGAQVIVLVPGEEVVLTRVSLPATNRQKMLKALPYTLEEQVVGDVDDVHFAAGERDADGMLNVAACSRRCMDVWQARLRDAGLMADVLMPDVLALPLRENRWVLVQDGERFMLRTGEQQGYVFDAANRDLYLGLMVPEAEKAGIEAIDVWAEQVIEWPGLVFEHQSLENGWLSLLKSGDLAEKLLNLQQGDYSRREQWGKIWRPWRFAAVVGGIAFLLNLGVTVVENSELSTQNDELKEQVVSIYKDAFPDARKVPNPRQQMEQKLKELRAGGQGGGQSFLDLMLAVGPSFSANTGVIMRSLRYKSGVLDIELEAPSLQSLDQLKQSLVANAHLEVEIQSAAAKDNKVQGRIQIKQGATS